VPYWRLFYHLIWSTRDRSPVIGADEEALIRRSFELTSEDLELIPHGAGIMPDHVHIVVSIPPKVAVAEVVRRLKGSSSNAVNHRGDTPRAETFQWQGDYGALSFGDSALARVIEYVEHQAQHHAEGRLWPKLEQADDGFIRPDRKNNRIPQDVEPRE
jgi:putative transposase